MGLIKKAKDMIEQKIGTIEKESSVYETAPWGFESKQNFLNQVVVIRTSQLPKEVLKLCLEIEDELGRQRKSNHYESRTMDIDILFYDDDIIKENNLLIPHPKLHERRFTLEPLVEIAPDYIHPEIKKSLHAILLECKDNGVVLKL
jgi:2-amino-4-hydroxy-6-hydroxymethyldihydropteridine diphosphokinase